MKYTCSSVISMKSGKIFILHCITDGKENPETIMDAMAAAGKKKKKMKTTLKKIQIRELWVDHSTLNTLVHVYTHSWTEL